jgi:hypothetical protein
VERLLLFVALLTGIALVSLDWSWMQFPTAGLHLSRQTVELLCRLGACFTRVHDSMFQVMKFQLIQTFKSRIGHTSLGHTFYAPFRRLNCLLVPV